jgi:NAD(P)H dehydrogenase (quinone)
MARPILTFLACTLLMAAAAGAASPARILIAYHSRTGNTEKMAVAVREGAASVAGVEIVLRKVAEVSLTFALRGVSVS